ncbi:HesA/MoeB/ThiF family protein [Isoalcanivorax beigongshangi]|uniref:ThiF family adenylyltransferase n=1 Tax=Isoalcanivorax beigongshangi TaxID=3238810 RepID=A0ABV4AHA1_9GAMM
MGEVDAMLTDAQLFRYSRQLLVAEFDLDGQAALSAARVVMVGAGGLGAPAALYLVGAGVGTLVVADPDHLEVSNLHRQIAYRQRDVGQAKASALAAELHALNPTVTVEPHHCAVDAQWLDAQLPNATVVLDCSDNFPTRSLLNERCHAHGVPLVSGAAIRLQGQAVAFDFRHPDSPCYGCLYGDGEAPELPCSQAGILGPVVGTVGTWQALMVLRLLSGERVDGVLHSLDGRQLTWRQHPFKRDPDCPVCAGR